MVFKQKTGSRAQVMHGNAEFTGGGLKKKDLKYNKHGKIVSKKLSAIAKKEKRLEKAGWTTIEGQFGAMQIGGGKNSTKTPLHVTTPYTRPSVAPPLLRSSPMISINDNKIPDNISNQYSNIEEGEVLENNNTVRAPLNRQNSNGTTISAMATHLTPDQSKKKMKALGNSVFDSRAEAYIYNLTLFKEGINEIGSNSAIQGQDIILVDLANAWGDYIRELDMLKMPYSINNLIVRTIQIITNSLPIRKYCIVFICNTYTAKLIPIYHNLMLNPNVSYSYSKPISTGDVTSIFVHVNTEYHKYAILSPRLVNNELDDLFLCRLAKFLLDNRKTVHVISNDRYDFLNDPARAGALFTDIDLVTFQQPRYRNGPLYPNGKPRIVPREFKKIGS